MIGAPNGTALEEGVIAAVQWLRLFVEAVGAIVIAIGIAAAIVALVRRMRGGEHVQSARHVLAHFLAIALEFQLAADILSTAVAPTWDQIGKLAAIAVIRTALNFFLTREMREQTDAARA
ncbi:MAG: DUF1622 domain-containing protein [Acidobacteriota bacterium]|nr:DUF1622 domain-containing protein [Acidobacteriota bacterium]